MKLIFVVFAAQTQNVSGSSGVKTLTTFYAKKVIVIMITGE
jgi:hypothetical protein